MSVLYSVVALVAAQRLAEVVYAGANTRRLKAEGAKEAAPAHYPLFFLLHGSWLVATALAAPADAPAHAGLLLLFFLLQLGRIWVIATLGKYWTTRIISPVGAPLVRRGPYRLMRHPNYTIVALEVAVLPLAFGEITVALVWSALNAGLLAWRIAAENKALAQRE